MNSRITILKRFCCKINNFVYYYVTQDVIPGSDQPIEMEKQYMILLLPSSYYADLFPTECGAHNPSSAMALQAENEIGSALDVLSRLALGDDHPEEWGMLRGSSTVYESVHTPSLSAGQRRITRAFGLAGHCNILQGTTYTRLSGL